MTGLGLSQPPPHPGHTFFPVGQHLAYLRNWQGFAAAQGTHELILKGKPSLLTLGPSQVSTRHWGPAEKAKAEATCPILTFMALVLHWCGEQDLGWAHRKRRMPP